MQQMISRMQGGTLVERNVEAHLNTGCALFIGAVFGAIFDRFIDLCTSTSLFSGKSHSSAI